MQIAASTSLDTARDGMAAETVWLEFRDQLRAFVARRVSNPADVDDLVQWAFLQMHRSLGEIRKGERIHAWLYSTARRAIADYYRSGSRRREVLVGGALDLDALRLGSEVPTDDASEASREVASCLAPVVDRLSPTDRDAIVLTEIRGLRVADAAARAGLSLSGMKSRVQRARRRLRKAMLDCCHLALDARGTPTSCVKRDPVGGPCCKKPAS
jgi:RNA polymerase sigma-70 factor, ECF subfamily